MARPKKYESGYYFDAKKKQFVTSKGVRLTPVPVPGLLVERLLTSKPPANGKIPVKNGLEQLDADVDPGEAPEPPEIEVDYGKGRVGKEIDDRDPEYLKELADWNIQHNIQIMMAIINFGIEEEPPERFVRITQEIDSQLGEASIKYMWVLNQMKDDNEAAALTEVIMGQNTPTADGVAEAEDSFPGAGGDESGA